MIPSAFCLSYSAIGIKIAVNTAAAAERDMNIKSGGRENSCQLLSVTAAVQIAVTRIKIAVRAAASALGFRFGRLG